MPKANTRRNGLTRIIIFEVDPHHQERLVQQLERAIRVHVSHRKGFISAVLLCNNDGSTVINYARWETEEDWLSMERDSAATQAFTEPFRLARSTSLRTYEECAFIEAGPRNGENA